MSKTMMIKNIGTALKCDNVDPYDVKNGAIWLMMRTVYNGLDYTLYERTGDHSGTYKLIAVPTRAYDTIDGDNVWTLDGISMKMIDNAYPVNDDGIIHYETTMRDTAGDEWTVGWDLINPDEDLTVCTNYDIFEWSYPAYWKKKNKN